MIQDGLLKVILITKILKTEIKFRSVIIKQKDINGIF